MSSTFESFGFCSASGVAGLSAAAALAREAELAIVAGTTDDDDDGMGGLAEEEDAGKVPLGGAGALRSAI